MKRKNRIIVVEKERREKKMWVVRRGKIIQTPRQITGIENSSIERKTGKYKVRQREKTNLLLSEDQSRNLPWPFSKLRLDLWSLLMSLCAPHNSDSYVYKSRSGPEVLDTKPLLPRNFRLKKPMYCFRI